MMQGSDLNPLHLNENTSVCAVVIQHYQASHAMKHFPELFTQILKTTKVWGIVLGKGATKQIAYSFANLSSYYFD